MIYSQATGGFGNQLYNYAIGFALSELYSEPLTIDISAYKYSDRPFVLNNLSISAGIENIYPASSNNKLSRMIARAKRILYTNRNGRCKWVKESTTTRNKYGSYDFSHHKNLYIEGFWQNYCYFDSIYDKLCNEFQPLPNIISLEANVLMQTCHSTNSVALHIRKGDYEKSWILSADYYRKAVSIISSSVDNPVYYIFCENSDYAHEVCDGFEGEKIYVTENNKFSDLEEFYLISACQNQVIANSSFSWWAAYLNRTPDKIVVAPVYLHWEKDYYPTNWILLD